jgi:hypothetical protein
VWKGFEAGTTRTAGVDGSKFSRGAGWTSNDKLVNLVSIMVVVVVVEMKFPNQRSRRVRGEERRGVRSKDGTDVPEVSSYHRYRRRRC